MVVRKCIAGDYRADLVAEFGSLDNPKCPACGSTTFKSRSSYVELVLLAATYLLMNIIFPARACVHRCNACNTWWREG